MIYLLLYNNTYKRIPRTIVLSMFQPSVPMSALAWLVQETCRFFFSKGFFRFQEIIWFQEINPYEKKINNNNMYRSYTVSYSIYQKKKNIYKIWTATIFVAFFPVDVLSSNVDISAFNIFMWKLKKQYHRDTRFWILKKNIAIIE